MLAERRRGYRWSMELPALVQQQEGEKREARILDVSHYGMMLDAQWPCAPSEEITVEFSTPSGSVFTFTGTVLWNRLADDGKIRFGVRFHGVSTELVAKVEQCVREVLGEEALEHGKRTSLLETYLGGDAQGD